MVHVWHVLRSQFPNDNIPTQGMAVRFQILLGTCIYVLLRARCNEKQIQETTICYLESQQKALLKFNKIY